MCKDEDIVKITSGIRNLFNHCIKNKKKKNTHFHTKNCYITHETDYKYRYSEINENFEYALK